MEENICNGEVKWTIILEEIWVQEKSVPLLCNPHIKHLRAFWQWDLSIKTVFRTKNDLNYWGKQCTTVCLLDKGIK